MHRIVLHSLFILVSFCITFSAGLPHSWGKKEPEKLDEVSALLEELSQARKTFASEKPAQEKTKEAFKKALARVTALREKYLSTYKEKAHPEERALHRLYYLLQYHETAFKNQNKEQGCSRLSFELERDKTSTREFKEALAWAELLCPKLKN